MRMGVGHQLVRVSFGHAREKQIAGFRTITVKETIRPVDPVVNIALVNLHPQALSGSGNLIVNIIPARCRAVRFSRSRGPLQRIQFLYFHNGWQMADRVRTVVRALLRLRQTLRGRPLRQEPREVMTDHVNA